MANKNTNERSAEKPSLSTPMTARDRAEKNGEQINKKKKFRISAKWFYNTNVLAVIALLCSFGLWCVVTLNDDNTSSTRPMTDIPIKIDTADIEETFGLQMIDIVDPPVLFNGKVNVTLHGTVYQLSQVSEDDVTVTAQVSGVNRAGEFTLGLVPACSVRGVSVTIDNNYDFVKVWFDRIKQKELSIDKVTANGVTVSEEDLIIGDLVSNVKTLTITGPESVVEQITNAQIYANVNKKLSEPLETVGRIIYQDADGGEIGSDKSRYVEIYDYNETESSTGTPAGSLAPEDIKVIIPVSKTATLPLGITFKNVPEGFDVSTLRYSLSPDKIKIEGDIEAIDRYIDAGIYNIEGIDLSSVSPLNNVIKTKLNLSTGIEELTGVTEVSVTVNLSGYSSRNITINSRQIKLKENAALTTQIMTESLNINIVGPSKAVDSINEADVTATVDMTEAELINGQRKMTAVISLNDKSDCWIIGSYTVMVNVEVKEGQVTIS